MGSAQRAQCLKLIKSLIFTPAASQSPDKEEVSSADQGQQTNKSLTLSSLHTPTQWARVPSVLFYGGTRLWAGDSEGQES